MPNWKTCIGLLLTIGFSLSGQVILKKSVVQVLGGVVPSAGEFISKYLWQVVLSPLTIAGVACCGLGLTCFLFVLATFDLSRAIPILGGMSYIALFFISGRMLQEQTSWLNFAGILVIIAGLIMVSVKPS